MSSRTSRFTSKSVAKSAATRSNSAGIVAGFDGRMSSTGSTKPPEEVAPHAVDEGLREIRRFCFDVIHAASALRVSLPFARSVPSSAVGFAFAIGSSSGSSSGTAGHAREVLERDALHLPLRLVAIARLDRERRNALVKRR